MPRHRYSLVACARWEETQIEEWVAYHRSIGFDHIYLYSNDDDPAPLFRAVAAYVHGPNPLITFRHWPVAGQQQAIYFHFLENFRHETEWFGFLDIDEFFVLKGVDNIDAFMAEYRDDVDCLYFHWVLYGNCDRKRRADTPTLTTYLRRASTIDIHIKMLCRSALIDASAVRQGHEDGLGAFWHFLDKYRLPGLRCRDILFHPMDGYAQNFPASAGPFVNRPGLSVAVLERAYIAHFQFRSEEDFMRRWHRGGFHNGAYWREAYVGGAYRDILASANAVYDSYLAEYWYRHTANGLRISLHRHPSLPLENVALNKPSWQSSELALADPPSASDRSPTGRTSGAGNNGVRTGSYGFHTETEDRPWWIVDLLAPHALTELHIYNCTDTPAMADAAADIDVLGSADGAAWGTLYAHPSVPFSQGGRKLIVCLLPGTLCRFVMLRRRGHGALHLNEVEVYGTPSDRRVPLVGTALSVAALIDAAIVSAT